MTVLKKPDFYVFLIICLLEWMINWNSTHTSYNWDIYEHPIDLFEIYGSFVSGNKRNPYQITNKLVAELISYIEGEIWELIF